MPLKQRLTARALVVCALCQGACSAEPKAESEAMSSTTGAGVPVGAYGGTGTQPITPTTEVDNAADAAGTSVGSEDCPLESRGADFYLQQDQCTRCHGDDALGVAGYGPEVRNPAPDYARWLMRTGRQGHPEFEDGMPAFSNCVLSDTMINEVLEFLVSFGKASDGKALYEDFCAGCHGNDGRGGITSVDLDAHLDTIESISMTGHMASDYENRSAYMPVMTDRLSGAEIELIREYLENELGL
jgi:cytochrome c oxidase cbb3-type subunit 3